MSFVIITQNEIYKRLTEIMSENHESVRGLELEVYDVNRYHCS